MANNLKKLCKDSKLYKKEKERYKRMEMLKKEEGVTVTILIIALVILLMIMGMLVFSSTESVNASNLISMNNDIELLSTKVSQYYLENEEIPVLELYDVGTTFDRTSAEQQILGANDGEVFHVIDLERLEGITLNYGRDYENIKAYVEGLGESAPDYSRITEYNDVYVINENSHNIFYVKGVVVGDEGTYHFNDLTPDDVEVELIEIDV